ncbi:hypothetical protein G7Y89_g14431 [Cudoniella acicularis]|uniref:Uncharacterized protein n=1 Tax=Cudoniella acicularis TaxID=354080 RepID=A0A8H4VTT5_9HELO|nr:hypothetical protein G7Y89_g14431 [Cudoniella acicularis]
MPLRTTPLPASLENLVRSVEAEELLQTILGRLWSADHFSRDEDIRRAGLINAAGLGWSDSSSYRTEDIVGLVGRDDLRRINLTAQLANSSITPRMLYAEIHPKMTSDGRYPRDFDVPRRVEEFFALEGTALDRLLHTYNLPCDLPYHSLSHNHSLALAPLLTIQLLFFFTPLSRGT